jgi:hypothetical protein
MTSLTDRRVLVAAILVSAVLARPAQGLASTVIGSDTQTAQESRSLNTGSGGFMTQQSQTILHLPFFDPSLGTLLGVAFDFSGSTYLDTGAFDDQAAAGSAAVLAQMRGIAWSVSSDATIGGTVFHTGASGFDDFGFSCGFCTTVSPGTQVTHTVGGPLSLTALLSNLDLSDFIGTGTFALPIAGSSVTDGALGLGINGFKLTPGPQFNLFVDTRFDPTLVATVTYTYDPAAVPIPEPGTLALSAIALVALARIRRLRA